ncbi:hypothetical protein F4808DRAFT_467009 [Astrocystis sublimbata]|nr:hypothetical protein F4808DRAFT_467009 [Astrocystis sublimbata]
MDFFATQAQLGFWTPMADSEDSTFEVKAGNPIMSAKTLKFDRVDVSKFGYLLASPTAEAVKISSCSWHYGLPDNLPPGAAHTLTLSHNDFYDFEFKELIKQFPKLRSLIYFRGPCGHEDNGYDEYMDVMTRVLVKYAKQLEHLYLENEGASHFEGPLGSLQGLRNLKTLEVDLEFLTGYFLWPLELDPDAEDPPHPDMEQTEEEIEQNYRAAESWSLVPLLPHSLEKVHLIIRDEKHCKWFNTWERL